LGGDVIVEVIVKTLFAGTEKKEETEKDGDSDEN
jgi:hypothetical protein